jgi:hypothetical protein
MQYPVHPDIAYYACEKYDGCDAIFGSEAGQDQFYIVYSYFLKQKNGANKYAEKRNNLVAIFELINEINRNLNYGGTYFSHQMDRIQGYAEYAVYSASGDYYEDKKYDVTKQKQIFSQSLKQKILDEEKVDFNTLGAQKLARRKVLMQMVNKLENLITNYFFLKKAQEFQYGYY